MHHAFLYIGPSQHFVSVLPREVQAGSVDVVHEVYERFGIDHARSLRERAVSTSFEGEKCFVLTIQSATIEAQNALLKLLEEPADNVQFYLNIPREDVCIQTLHSRLMRIDDRTNRSFDTTEAETLLSLTIKDQLEEIGKRTKAKDIQWVEAVLTGIEALCYQKKQYRVLKELLFVRQYAAARGASHKMLLEHLMLSIREAERKRI